MDKETFIYADLDGVSFLTGRLWTRLRKEKESATFQYDEEWLKNPARFSLEPALHLDPGPFHTSVDMPIFGAIGDSAPDRWGRTLMRRMERRRAEREGNTPHALQEIDFLLLVDDETRQGALRFTEQLGGPFLREKGTQRIPPVVELPKLLSAAENVMEDKDTEEELRLLFAPGSSLGGARPKASVIDKNGHLMIAKFPRKDDEVKIVLWEAVSLALALKSGIAVPENRIESISRKPVLLLRRFDREGKRRIPFLSAMSMLGARDNDNHNYLELVDALRKYGAAPKADMEALWRRLVFNILVSNTDDHLRNHGFLYAGQKGWRLSPAYDLNPVPADIKPRILATAINEESDAASLELAMEAAGYFGLNAVQARKIAAEAGKVVSDWRGEAARFGLTKKEIDRMTSAFEHKDSDMARSL